MFALMGVFGLMALTYPIAMFRVSNMEKFQGYHVKSLTLDYHAGIAEPKTPQNSETLSLGSTSVSPDLE
ncbi:MAG: hypothetical protein HC784_12390 [Hydrococcus sp. CSU_1_8]|nr:hypothetical protein [Hydrococcus sp. CSU_1_8]